MNVFKPGDVVFDSVPLVHVLTWAQKGLRCDHCFKPRQNLKKCSRCKHMYYCNAKCQTDDWTLGHKFQECAHYSNPSSQGLFKFDSDRLLLRLFLKAKFDEAGCSRNYSTVNGESRTLDDLMDHFETLQTDPVRLKLFHRIVTTFEMIGIKYQRDQLMSLFGKNVTNAYQISDNCFQIIGIGLYIDISVIDHSCQPNVAVVFEGPRAQVRAIRHVDTNVEPLSIIYTDLKGAKQIRQNKLKELYYFDCECSKCISDKDETINYDQLKQLDSEFNQLISDGDDWQAAYLIGLQSLPIYHAIYGDYHPVVTVQLIRVLQAKYYIKLSREQISGEAEKSDEQLKKLTEQVMDAIRITHGFEHSLYQSDLKTIMGVQ